MKTVLTLQKKAIWLLIGGMLLSCDPWFAYSPYESNVQEAYRETTRKNLELIAALSEDDSKPFKIALLADPHYHFGKLEDAIAHINSNPEYVFAIVAGDLTENGLMQEYVYFHETMSRLRIPYLTVIGNHDYLANGERVYDQMYGLFNYTFVFNNTKFVLFDNNTIESEMEPDFQWVGRELVNNGEYHHVIPVSHIPPYDGQMDKYRNQYHELLVRNEINLSVHGHRHDFSLEKVFGDAIEYLTISSPQKRTYAELTVSPTVLEVKKIDY